MTDDLKALLEDVGKAVCLKVHSQLRSQSIEKLSSVHMHQESDIIYSIDKDAEDIIVELFEERAEAVGGIVLLAEGIGDERLGETFPKGIGHEEAKWKVIMDPIDGTRCIMYDKRSAFYLASAAPNANENKLSQCEVAVMVELPNSRSVLSDILWAFKGEGAFAKTWNIESDHEEAFQLRPSKAKNIDGGFAQLVRFFPPGRDILSKIEDELIELLIPDFDPSRAIVFEDQYISTGGQIYELLKGHDRFTADIRHLLYSMLAKEGKKAGHVCHPYDNCTVLIAWEAGIHITDAYGNDFDNDFDLHKPSDWIGYANQDLRNKIEPVLQELLKKYGLISRNNV